MCLKPFTLGVHILKTLFIHDMASTALLCAQMDQIGTSYLVRGSKDGFKDDFKDEL